MTTVAALTKWAGARKRTRVPSGCYDTFAEGVLEAKKQVQGILKQNQPLTDAMQLPEIAALHRWLEASQVGPELLKLLTPLRKCLTLQAEQNNE